MPPRIVLVGLPGVGKSSVGARLARRLAVPFADSDDLVVRRTGRSVTAIFAADGEPEFRRAEAAAIAAAMTDFDGVLALGGGAVTTPAVRRALTASPAPVVHLTAGQGELLRRIGSHTHRPLLAENPAERLAHLAETRAELYREVATFVFDTAALTPNAVAEALHHQLTGASPQ